MMREFSVIIEKDEDGYFVASVPGLRGCHTQARSLDVLMKRIREAIILCLDVQDLVTSRLEALLAQVTEANRHGEVDTDPAVGGEA